MRPILVHLSMFYHGTGYSSAAVALAREFARETETTLFLPQTAGALPADLPAVRPFPLPLPGRIAFGPKVLAVARRRTEARLLAAVKRAGRGTVVWLWPDASTGLLRALKAEGAILVREMINTHRATAKRILDTEYARIGRPDLTFVTEAQVAEEREQLALMDFLVSPGEGVDESLIENGIAPERVIRSTFGWEPGDFARHERAATSGRDGVFVGRVSVRKGIHLALAAWEAADTGGVLTVVGQVDADSAALVERWSGRPDVRFLPFTLDLEACYRRADFMLFPTLEEGAPLVCYQAAGCGLPIVTSIMGAGRIVEDGASGFIVAPHDADGLVMAIRRIGDDAALRARMAAEAQRRAGTVTWANAAAKRLAELRGRLA